MGKVGILTVMGCASLKLSADPAGFVMSLIAGLHAGFHHL